MNNTSFSNKLKILDFFNVLKEEIYVCIKLWEYFPNYYPYSDIDIFCFDIKSFTKIILSKGNFYVEQGFDIIVNYIEDFHVQIDFYPPNCKKLDFRFDLYSSIPNYKKVNINSALFFSILENRKTKIIIQNGAKYSLSIPCQIDEFIIRYLEFIEFYDQREDKIKHLDFIISKVKNNDKQKFIEKLHLYTKLSLLPVPINSHFNSLQNKTVKSNEIGIKQSLKYLFIAVITKTKKAIKSVLFR